MNKASRLVISVLCAAALAALPFATSCSAVMSAVNSLTGPSSSSSQEADAYYLGIDENGFLALYKGTPGDGSDPVRTTDIAVADLHESVVEGLKEGIVFDSFNEAIERIGDYRAAAKSAADTREAEKSAEEKAADAAKNEAEKVEAAPAQPEAAEPAEPAAQQPESQPAQPAATATSDENAPAGEFWGVWLGTFPTSEEAESCAEQAKSQGFEPEVFEVTNWDGTNYVVGVGEFATKSEAQNVLSHAIELGYSSAYLHTAVHQ